MDEIVLTILGQAVTIFFVGIFIVWQITTFWPTGVSLMRKLYYQIKANQTFRFGGKMFIKLGRDSMDETGKRRRFRDSEQVMLEK